MAFLSLPGEEAGLSGAHQSCGHIVIRIEDQQIILVLKSENILFRLHIFFHILMDIQMIGGQIGDHRSGGAAAHIHQLEGAEFHHCKIRFCHLGHFIQQGRTNIATQPHGLSIGFQHFRDQRGGSGLSVRAGNC